MELMPMLTPSVGTAREISRETRHGVVDVVRVVEAALEEDAASADGLGVFRRQRPLLGRGCASAERSRMAAMRPRDVIGLRSERDAAEAAPTAKGFRRPAARRSAGGLSRLSSR